jgi:hypothetical protein
VFAGVGTGWMFVSVKRDEMVLKPDNDKSGFRIREYLGMRYHFNPTWSFFIEDSGYLSTLAAGATYKF